MKLIETKFGELDGMKISQFTLENNTGMTVKVMNYGATITSITIPDKEGNPISIACGFDSFEEYFSENYRANSPYFGCTVGRYCSQIKDSKFTLNGIEYQLAANCGENNLHGGVTGFDKKIWNAETFERKDSVGINFTLKSHDGEEGFPGNVLINLQIQLTNKNEIRFNYRAKTDQATPLSLTNHSYFNLSGFKQNVESHRVKVYTNLLQEMDNSGAATGKILDVAGTINDLQNGSVVGDVHKELGEGFEHFYVFNNPDFKLQKVAEIEEPASERKLEVFSTEPCMLFYTGKYTSDSLKRNDTEKYGKYRGFCFETHRVQNGPNIQGSPKSITNPEEIFESQTIFKIS